VDSHFPLNELRANRLAALAGYVLSAVLLLHVGLCTAYESDIASSDSTVAASSAASSTAAKGSQPASPDDDHAGCGSPAMTRSAGDDEPHAAAPVAPVSPARAPIRIVARSEPGGGRGHHSAGAVAGPRLL